MHLIKYTKVYFLIKGFNKIEKRRRRDSNPRNRITIQRFSRPPHSAALARLRYSMSLLVLRNKIEYIYKLCIFEK